MRIVPFVLALGLAVGSWTAPVGASPVDEGGVNLVAAPSFAGVVRPGQALQVTGTVTNSTGQDMDAGIASVYLPNIRIPDRDALSAWLDSDEGSAGIPLGQALGSTAIGELAPGQVRAVTITIPPAAIAASETPLTTLPLAIRLASGTVEVDFMRSAVVRLSAEASPQVSLTVVTPLVTPPDATGLLDAEELSALTAPGGQLDVQLRTALAHSVAIGLDPMIPASIRLLGTSAPQSALDWLAALESAPGDVFPLGYADADPALAVQAGLPLPLDPLGFPIDESLFPPVTEETPAPDATPVPAPEPTVPTQETLLNWNYSVDGLAWPAPGSVAAGDVGALANAGYSRILLDSGQVTGGSAAGPNVTIRGDADRELGASVSDDTVSRLLRTAANAATDVDANAAITELSAHLALAATGRDATLIATLGRDGSASGPRLDSSLTALESLPWVAAMDLTDALALPATPASFVPLSHPDDRVITARSLLAAEQSVTAFSSVVDEPGVVTEPRRLALLALLGESWAFDQAGWAAATGTFFEEGRTIVDSVRIPEGSVINFPLEKGNLPIAVTNDLDFPVTVYVTVQPARAILDVLNDRVELKIEANSQSKASIPVQSIANGEVRTTVSLASATGVQISTPTSVDLNVQAGWETAATVVLAIVVVVMFAAGIARTALRWRKGRAAPVEGDADTADPDAAPADTADQKATR